VNQLLTSILAHSRAVLLFYFAVSIAGYLAFTVLPSDVYPELSFPKIAIIAHVGDTSAERVLVTVTRTLEEAAGQVYGVRYVRSKTIRGATELSVDFQSGTDMVFALHQLQSRINEVQSHLPSGVGLTVELVTPAIFPVMSYNITTNTLTQADLYTICRYQLQPLLSKVKGVARVQLQGGDLPQVMINISSAKLKDFSISLEEIANVLRRSNQIQVVGRVDENHEQNLVVATSEVVDVNAIESIVISTRGTTGTPIYVKDLGTVTMGYADRQSIVSIRNKRGVVLNIFRQPNSSVVNLSDAVQKTLRSPYIQLPKGISLEKAYDEAALVKASMLNVRDAILIGVALIILVLFIFLRSISSTLIASLTIPLSVLAAFCVLFLTRQNLNLMSLGGIAVAVGLVIDDAIVVIENIHRQMLLESNKTDAVKKAVSELIGPITSSTATTVVVFLPLGLLSGVAGQFFTSLTITLTSAVCFSWLISLTLTPLLTAKLTGHKKENAVAPENRLSAWQKVYETYALILEKSLKFSFLIAIFAIGLIAFSAMQYMKLGSDFLPAVDEGSYVLDYLAPPGAALSDVDAFASKLESIVARTPEVATWTRRTGAELGIFATQTNKGDILVVLKPANQRKRKIEAIMDEQRDAIKSEVPQLDVDFHQILQDQLNDLSGAPKPVEVRVFGENPNRLRAITDKLSSLIAVIPGIVDPSITSHQLAPKIDLHIDSVKAGRFGLTPADVSTQVQDALFGAIVSQIRQGDRLIDVRVKLADSDKDTSQDLAQIPIIGTASRVLHLDQVATTEKSNEEREIYCENQLRYASVEAELENRDLGSVVRDVKKQIATVKTEDGYSIQVTGLYATQQQSFHELLLVSILAAALVYLLLVIQFKSFLQPLAIFTALPLAMTGVIGALYYTKTPLNVSSFMGVILLIGLVVKNGIILLEYTNRLREGGLPLEKALVEAGKIRLRPIVMTTLCTLLGLLPLAIGLGAGAELQKPLAIAVIGGLSLSTLLTLIVVPVAFLWLEKLSSFFGESESE
jgi:CzcA family heavy metal efflux pump